MPEPEAEPVAGPQAPAPTTNEVDAVAKAVVEKATPEKRYTASIYPRNTPLPDPFVDAVKQIESVLGCPLWVLIQNERPGQPWSEIDAAIYNGFFSKRHLIERGKPVALLLDSPGGSAAYAYKIARLFQRRASEFSIVVPKYAKSAATLLALGASRLVMGEDAELGPLDVQIWDAEREEFGSALNAAQSLERLHAFSLETVDQMTPLLMKRTGRKLDTLLPQVLKYAVDFVRPLLEKIDTVDYTKKSRELKVAEQYAVRLMQPHYDEDTARRIAQHLVDKYPAHGFVIDRDEAGELVMPDATTPGGGGLNIEPPSPEMDKCLDNFMKFVDRLTVAGHIVELPDEKTKSV